MWLETLSTLQRPNSVKSNSLFPDCRIEEFSQIYQAKTLKSSFTIEGIGVHSGKVSKITVHPSIYQQGIFFVREDLLENGLSKEQATVEARWDYVSSTTMCTTISNEHGVSVSTIEHLMFAFFVEGISNAVVYINSPEVPILDGSSCKFIDLIKTSGVSSLSSSVPMVEVLKPISIQENNSFAALYPSKERTLTVTFDGNGRFQGKKWSISFDLDGSKVADHVGDARSFGFFEDAEKVWALGFAKGTSLENSVIIDKDGKIMNEEGLRHSDEFIRHKVLDILGDISLAQCMIKGAMEFYNPSHTISNKLLRELFRDISDQI